MMSRSIAPWLVVLLFVCTTESYSAETRVLRAGATKTDITPRTLPAIRNGGFIEVKWDRVESPLFSRALVMSDGEQSLAIVVVDSCMIPRDVCDEIKRLVAAQTDLMTDRIMISATHCHSAPSVMSYCLGSRKDEPYTKFMIPRVADGAITAWKQMQPAQAGWGVKDCPKYTACRRWIKKDGLWDKDPFGEETVRAMMHPGFRNPLYTESASAVDSGLTILDVRTTAGAPICVLANFSMHYFGGARGFSSDYFGDFTTAVEAKLAKERADEKTPEPVAIMSQGTSGELYYVDYTLEKRWPISRQQYAIDLANFTAEIRDGIKHTTEVDLDSAQTFLPLKRRRPSDERLGWARQVEAERKTDVPRTRPEVYAQQAVWLDENRESELVIQSMKVGDLAITALPNEVYSITGLKLKDQSPFPGTMNISLANGADGYIPPAEQHFMGGYNTWPARTAGLEVDAERKIVNVLLSQLEVLSGRHRRRPSTDFYSAGQHRAFAKARIEDNNRENRGAVAQGPAIRSVAKIYDAGKHNAFTDLIRFNGEFLCTFRTGTAHVSPDGALQLLASGNGEAWKPIARLTSEEGDLRDPKLCITPKNELMLTAAIAYPKGTTPSHQSLAWFSKDGRSWSKPHKIGDPGFWMWRVTWHSGKAYAVGYLTRGERTTRLYVSDDGKAWKTHVPEMIQKHSPNEATIIFSETGEATCLQRREGSPYTGLLGTSSAPYTRWTFKELDARIGGPNLLRLPDGRLLAVVRRYEGLTRTALCWIDEKTHQLVEFQTLPSGGDTSYAGLVWNQGELWISYYSKPFDGDSSAATAIYLARVSIPLQK